MIHSFTKALLVLLLFTNTAFAADPLPSWNEGAAKQSIETFVEKVTKQGSPDFVPVLERIAAFGDSRGDKEMFEYTQVGSGTRAIAKNRQPLQ